MSTDEAIQFVTRQLARRVTHPPELRNTHVYYFYDRAESENLKGGINSGSNKFKVFAVCSNCWKVLYFPEGWGVNDWYVGQQKQNLEIDFQWKIRHRQMDALCDVCRHVA